MTRLAKLEQNFLASEVDGEVILVHGESGAFFAMKDVALAIWHLLDEEANLERISQRLQQEYDVGAEQCRASVDRFASQLVEAGFAEFA